VILLTGASGVVGQAFLHEAADRDIAVLRHRTPVAPAAGPPGGPVRARTGRVVVGDVTQPRLGLDEATYDELCRDIDTVLHAAALVSFGARPGRYAAVNVEGTRQVAELARDARASLVYVSTAFVHEGISRVAPPSPYEATKRAAEQVVRASGVPATIARPSIVTGDSATGVIAVQQGFHAMMQAMVLGPVRVFPGDPDGYADFVAQDYVAKALLAAVDHPPAGELWITSGEAALRNEDVVALLNEFIAGHGLGGDPIRVVPFDTIERLFLPVFLPELPRAQRAFVKRVLHHARYMNVTDPLPSSAAHLERLAALALPDAATVFRRNLDAWWAAYVAGQRADAEAGRPEQPGPVGVTVGTP
jgi:nucleoside-diphosphate-sugar epimerase